MILAVLVTFQYEINTLPGASSDLELAEKWCKTFTDKSFTFTDFEYPRSLKVHEGEALVSQLVKLLRREIPEKLVLYYSGHGVKDSLVMPNRELLSFKDFKDNILNALPSYTEIFCILDCCNPSGLYLPFKLSGNAFQLSPFRVECVTQPMLLIASSEEGEKAVALKTGSLFSKHLFRILTTLNSETKIPNGKNRNLHRLVTNLSSEVKKFHTGHPQTVSIYSSYVTDPVLWTWIGSKKSYNIVTDPSLTTIFVRS